MEGLEFMTRSERKIGKYVISYLTIILVIFSIVYVTVRISGYMYMFGGIGADTYAGQLPSLAYAKHLLSDIKLFDFEFGLGMSTTGAISNILDPFNWPCFFFSDYNLDYGIFIGTFLRYLCLAYYAYKYIGIKKIENWPRVICSLMIVFCGWFVGWGQHYCIGTIFVAFIAILYYFECWLQKSSFVKLVLSVAFLAIISIYFCYMALIFLMFYYFISLYYSLISKRISVKKAIIHIIKTGCLMIGGICCAAFIFLSSFGDTVTSSRVTGTYPLSFSLATVKEYASIVFRMLSNSILGIETVFLGYGNYYESPYMYVSILAVLLIPLFLMSKNYLKKYWVSILITLFTFICVNFSSVIFNGFSTKTYRWTFVFVPVLVLVCGKVLSDPPLLERKKSIIAIALLWDITLVTYLFWIKYHYEPDRVICISYLVVFALLNVYVVVLFKFSNRKYLSGILFFLVAMDLGMNAYISVHERPLITQAYKNDSGYYDDTNEALEYLESIDSSFYRISKKYNIIDLNDSLIQHYNGEKVYTSLLSGAMWDMIDLFDLRVKQSNYLYGFDDKQILRNLTVGKYRFTLVPADYYGYKFIEKVGDVYIYENSNCSEFGTLYECIDLRSNIYGKDAYELQNILLEKCIIADEEYNEAISEFLRSDDDNLEISKKLIFENNNLDTSTYSIKEEFENKNPLLIQLTGENASGTIEIRINNPDKTGKKRIVVDSIPYTDINGYKTYYIDALNVSAIKIVSATGNVTQCKVYEVSGKELTEKIHDLNENHMIIDEFSDSYISGYVDSDDKKMLFIPVPYSNNWKVMVNGNEEKVYRADAGFMAVVLPKGHSEIKICYTPQYFYIGCMVSGVSLFILLVCSFFAKKKRRIDLQVDVN